jgi:phosphatidylglycerophosphate synthase
LFLFAISTDLLDGYFARKLDAASTLGAYFDATVDFLFVSSLFLVFILGELYPLWILLLTVTVFVQFILTNLYMKRTVYDPAGKHYGSLMYIGVGATLFFPEQLVYSAVTIGIVVFTAVSLSSRLAYFLLAQNRK